MNLDKVLITGSGGMIGRAIPFGKKLPKEELDITDINKIEQVVNEYKLCGILNLAGLDIRTVQADPKRAVEVNAIAVQSMAKFAKRVSIPLFVISAGAVFNGAYGETFNEESIPSPVNLYGTLKYFSERIVQDIGCEYGIIRTGWVFGGHGSRHKKFIDVAIDQAMANEPIIGNSSQTGSPTCVGDLIEEIAKIIQNNGRGTFHIVNSGIATGWDIACEIKKILCSESKIIPFPPNMQKEADVCRSPSEALVSLKLKLRPWQEALLEYISHRIAENR